MLCKEDLQNGGIIHCFSMEGFSSLPRKGLLLFEGVGTANFAKLDLKPCFTPMIWCLEKILGFGLKKKKINKKKKIREKERNKVGKYLSFPFILGRS